MNNEIKLYGPIGGYFGITAEEILNQIPEDATEITLRIHSPGGSVGEGLAMYNALRDHEARVICIVDGYAASSASFVMLAGDEIKVHKSSMVFIHNPWTVAEGNSNELRKVAEDLDKHADAILEIYKDRTGMDETELRQMMDDSIFMLGAEAHENGFADSVIDDAEANNAIAAMLDFDRMAAQLKGEEMTTVKTRKEVAAERDALAVENKAQAEQLDVFNGLQVEFDAAMESNKTLTETVDALTTDAANHKAEVDALNAELETTKQAIKRPETVDAATVAATEEVVDTPVDELTAKPENGEPVNHAEVYNDIAEPRLRMAYWREHENEIINSTQEK